VTIVGNLVDNALDAVATQVGDRRVRVDARVDDGWAVLVVEDSGPGLPSDEVERAFRRGYSTKQAAGEGRRGLGLALVAQSVQHLGGALRVEGPPGARFVVRVPLQDTT
jgi:sensor histidine kinase regulating citrate/malate metabolism